MKNNRIFGYLYDFWVFVVGQTTNETELNFQNLKCFVHPYSGLNSFAFPVCDSDGTYYNVLTSHLEEGGTLFIKENPQYNKHFFCAPWKSQAEIQDIKSIQVDAAYIDVLTELLHHLLNQSPARKLYVQIRRQGLEKDNIVGMLTVEQFSQMMKKDELLGNMVYVIHEPLEKEWNS